MYYAITRFFNDGRCEGEILLESEAHGKYQGGECRETAHFDEYCDKFKTYEEAQRFVDELAYA